MCDLCHYRWQIFKKLKRRRYVLRSTSVWLPSYLSFLGFRRVCWATATSKYPEVPYWGFSAALVRRLRVTSRWSAQHRTLQSSAIGSGSKDQMLSPPVLPFAAELWLMHLVCSEEFTATWFACEFRSPERPPTKWDRMWNRRVWYAEYRISRSAQECKICLFCRETVGEVDLHRSQSIFILNVSLPVFPDEDFGVFPLPRTSLGKGFREFSAGGIWQE